MEKSFAYKTVVLLVSLVACTLLGNGLLYGTMTLMGADLSSPQSIPLLLGSEEQGVAFRLAMAGSQLLIFTGAAALYWWVVSVEPFGKYFSLYPKPNWTIAGLCFLLLIASYPLISASGIVLEYVTLPDWATEADDSFAGMIEAMFDTNGLLGLFLSLVIVSVLPAVGEELLFRGIVQKELHRRLKSPHIAILITSLLFSGVHLQVQGFLPKFIISYILCYSYLWSRSLWVPMGLHLFNNGMLSLTLIVHKDQLDTLPKNETVSFPWVLVGISLFLCTILIEQIRKHSTPEKHSPHT